MKLKIFISLFLFIVLLYCTKGDSTMAKAQDGGGSASSKVMKVLAGRGGRISNSKSTRPNKPQQNINPFTGQVEEPTIMGQSPDYLNPANWGPSSPTVMSPTSTVSHQSPTSTRTVIPAWMNPANWGKTPDYINSANFGSKPAYMNPETWGQTPDYMNPDTWLQAPTSEQATDEPVVEQTPEDFNPAPSPETHLTEPPMYMIPETGVDEPSYNSGFATTYKKYSRRGGGSNYGYGGYGGGNDYQYIPAWLQAMSNWNFRD